MAAREYHEGPDAAERFESSLRRILKISKEELLKREADWKRTRAARKPRRKKSA
jgi:hypothetical protein